MKVFFIFLLFQASFEGSGLTADADDGEKLDRSEDESV